MDERERDKRHDRGILPGWLAWLVVLAFLAMLGAVLVGADDPPCAPPGISLLGPGECGGERFRPL